MLIFNNCVRLLHQTRCVCPFVLPWKVIDVAKLLPEILLKSNRFYFLRKLDSLFPHIFCDWIVRIVPRCNYELQ